ncbi:hypothetical protein MGN70_009913 [Eutypa lata]|uniref:Putative yl1 nuclear protein n=1 Tax=Eutypa lata (strain UCR-EL1) TaxID=1287681 RepID=M7S7G4_EUTLA|nr:putative yl1 nuclear protein [Eutypa lata UCREL1]KAI1248713.1 hypothetical protein MGN70_009913 [Eutypa lata]
MAAPTEAQIAHQELIDKLDIHSIHKSFRNPHWKPNQRRNKNIKTILSDAQRKEASSIIATPQDANSGTVTPGGTGVGGGDKDDGLSTSGSSTPVAADGKNGGSDNLQPNLAQASRSLSKLVLEKTLRQNGSSGGGGGVVVSAPSATYTNIESAPSLAHTKRYCDVTGLPAPYLDPKSRLRYHDKEVFAFIRSLPQGTAEQYLEARGAHTVLK